MRILSVCLLFLLTSLSGLAQEKPAIPEATAPPVPESKVPASGRVRIGVALEGGGALGFAHIGVLKWFEEHHIPIDYLAGTSMGGLVGGFYATGKSADELKGIVQDANWPLLLNEGTPYQDLAFRRKEDAREVPNSFRIGLRNGVTLPPGLNSGHQINLLMDRETLPYSDVHSFDDLPIPFRCVSTELISGQPYVFTGGSLSDAMRATISIPGVFAPVRQGEQIFVDGGLVDNLPTDVVRKMGADVVIAVHLQISKTSAKDIQSAFTVLGRSVELVIAETEIRGMAGADLLVKVDVEQYSSSDYEKSEPLIQQGYEAAGAKAAVLKAYSLNDADWAEYMQQKQSRRRTTASAPQFVKVEGVDSRAASSIQDFLTGFIGKPLNSVELDHDLTRLTGVGRYDSVTYGMVEEGGRQGLLVRVHEKTYAPPLLQPYVIVDGSQTDDVTFTLGARITAMDVWGYRSEWRTDLQVGQTYGIATELFKPIRPLGKPFFAPFLDADQSSFKVYFKSDPRAEYRFDRVLGGFHLGYSINRFSEIRVGYGLGYYDAELRLGQPAFSPVDGRVGALHARFLLDHTNEPVIPTSGYYLQSRVNFFDANPGATEAFPSLETEADYYQPVSSKGSLFFTARGGTTFGYRHVGTPQFYLGGPRLLSAYGLHELLGNQYYFGRAGYLHKVFTLPQFVGKQVYFSSAIELGKMFGDPLAPRLSGDAVGGLLAETAFGPVFIGGSVGDTGHQKWYFQLGRVF